mmetsp:Transcript_61432/g.143856  ORF Transcript_61432/g.143856 Transcript_61432/m.143856 type:complete len:265 (+) Transcript_61432:305-1099(+)
MRRSTFQPTPSVSGPSGSGTRNILFNSGGHCGARKMDSRSVAASCPSALIPRQPLLLCTKGSGATLTKDSSALIAATAFIAESRVPPQVSHKICTRAWRHTSSTCSTTSPRFPSPDGGRCFFEPRSHNVSCCRKTESTPAIALCCGLSSFRRALSPSLALMLSRRMRYSMRRSCELILLPRTFSVCSASSITFMLLAAGSGRTFFISGLSGCSAGSSTGSSSSSSSPLGLPSLEKLGSSRAKRTATSSCARNSSSGVLSCEIGA